MRALLALLVAALSQPASRPAALPQPASRPTAASQPIAASPSGVEMQGQVCVIDVHSSINPGSGAYIIQSLGAARKQGCGALIVTLDTPGGLLSTTRDIVKAMLAAPLPVIVYVSPAGAVAGSAGVFITLSGHVAAMAQGTHIGAAHPVGVGGGKDASDDEKVMAKKVENDAVAFIDSIAQERGRNREWAVKAVRESVSVSAQEALDKKVIDLLARDLPELCDKLDGRVVTVRENGVERAVRLVTKGQPLRHIGMSVSQRLTNAFADPQVAYLLMTFGMLGLAMELYHPGAIFPGVAGAISLLLAFVSFQVLPIDWGGVVLMLLGLAMLVAEIFVTAHGVLGVGGAVAVVLGGLLLINVQDPNYFVEPSYALSWRHVLPLGLVFALVSLFLVWAVLRSRARRTVTGEESLVGEAGVVSAAIAPGAPGLVRVHGELWQAESREVLDAGAEVQVEAVNGLRITVRARPPRP